MLLKERFKPDIIAIDPSSQHLQPQVNMAMKMNNSAMLFFFAKKRLKD